MNEPGKKQHCNAQFIIDRRQRRVFVVTLKVQTQLVEHCPQLVATVAKVARLICGEFNFFIFRWSSADMFTFSVVQRWTTEQLNMLDKVVQADLRLNDVALRAGCRSQHRGCGKLRRAQGIKPGF
eukprot:SAG31_NODE_394_length_16282_cov_132.890564_6_plen_125_part_00